MKIGTMEQVRQNLEQRVLFQSKWDEKPVQGRIVFGKTEDCEGDVVGYDETYSVLYDEAAGFCSTWCDIKDDMDIANNILIFETLE